MPTFLNQAPVKIHNYKLLHKKKYRFYLFLQTFHKTFFCSSLRKKKGQAMWSRLTSMYTHRNLVFLLLFRWLPAKVQDIVRASTFLILVVVATVWVSGDLLDNYAEFVDSFGVSPSDTAVRIAAVCDVLIHAVPVLMIGLPRHANSILIAFGILSSWYASARRRISEIYVPNLQGSKADSGVAVAGLVAFASWSYLQTKNLSTCKRGLRSFI